MDTSFGSALHLGRTRLDPRLGLWDDGGNNFSRRSLHTFVSYNHGLPYSRRRIALSSQVCRPTGRPNGAL